MKRSSKLVFTAMAVVLLTIGALAIVSETHTGHARFVGVRTLVGSDAVWFGRTCLLLAALPLLVWLPQRWLAAGTSIWWVTFMAWTLGPFLLR